MNNSELTQPITLRDGHAMPRVGLGMWKVGNDDEAIDAVVCALGAGYGLIDTASVYGNEEATGKGMKESGVPRSDIFLTTKVWNEDQGYETTLAAIDASLARLATDYVDLYLIHWPFLDFSHPDAAENKRAETWKAMERILALGKAKSIGVSNYTIDHLEEMKTYAHTMPSVNQIEFHPFWFRKDLMEYCHAREIAVEAYSPLSRAKKLSDARITAIAEKYHKSNAQILLRWNLQHGNVVIPKSTHKERIQENIALFDFSLTDEDMRAIDMLDEGKSVLFG
jgi:diketogulonate reductase-like aldo/keto reductase